MSRGQPDCELLIYFMYLFNLSSSALFSCFVGRVGRQAHAIVFEEELHVTLIVNKHHSIKMGTVQASTALFYIKKMRIPLFSRFT